MPNKFSEDANCIALYRFESGALTTDSKGTDTLTNASVIADTDDFKEGAACAIFDHAYGQHLYRTDANLTSGFPMKSGTTNKTISVCAWFKIRNLMDHLAIVAKWDTNAQRSITPLRTYNSSGSTYKWRSAISTNGTAIEYLYEAGTPQANRWYHFGFTFKDSDKSWKLVIWDDTAESKIVNTSGTATGNVFLSTARFTVGLEYNTNNVPQAVSAWDGWIDEVVIFDRILSTDEIDQIRTQTFGPQPASTFWPIVMRLLNQ